MIERLARILALLKDPRVPKLPRFLVIFAVIYTLIPSDLVPDFAPVIGWLDDLTLLWVALRWLLRSGSGVEIAGKTAATDTTAERLP